jgi:hypothetical protein
MISLMRRHRRLALLGAVFAVLTAVLGVRTTTDDTDTTEAAPAESTTTSETTPVTVATTLSTLPDGVTRCWGGAGAEPCQAPPSTTLPPEAAPPPETVPPVAAAVPPGGFPNAASTGVPAGWQPAAVHEGDLWVTTPGAVVENVHVTGSIEVRANDVTIRNTRVEGGIWNQENDAVQYGGLLIEDTEVGPESPGPDAPEVAIGTAGYTASRVEIHGVPDGFRVAGPDVRIESSFVDLSDVPGECAHLDGVQGYGGGDNVIVHGNTIDARGSCSTSAVFMASASAHLDLQNNLLLGGAYSIHLNQVEAPATFVSLGNSVVEGSYDYGPSKILDSGALELTCGGNRLVAVDADYQVTADRGEIPC